MLSNLQIYGVFKRKRNMINNRISLIAWTPLALLLTGLYLLYITTPIRVGPNGIADRVIDKGLSSYSDFLIKTNGCRIVHMDPFDESIRKYIEKPNIVGCYKKQHPLFETNGTFLLMSDKSQAVNSILESKIVSCCYKSFTRVSERHVKYANDCVPIQSRETRMESEFINVICSKKAVRIYDDYFSFVTLKNYKAVHEDIFASRPLNVLIIGLDSVSRLNLHRQMPETVKFLKSASAVEFLGYNKVGDNTLPNVLALLTGVSHGKLRSTVLTEGYYDKCPFIWNLFKEKGYVTAFGEDSSWMGSFNYMTKGFRSQPTDYYWNTFNYEAEFQIGNNKPLNTKLCLGSRFVYKDFLNYIDHFTTEMHTANRKYFAFFWFSSFCHDYLNFPRIADENFKHFFRRLVAAKDFSNTALFFVSDHGIRWGEIVKTFQGQLETRLPFLYVLLPEWFKQKYDIAYRNLQSNSAKVTSPFDVYKTMRDLLDMDATTYQERLKPVTTQASSLFNNISSSRTCKDSGISERWCACEMSLQVEKKLEAMNESASAVVEWINSKLLHYPQCSKLTLKSIVDASSMSNWYIVNKKSGFIHFNLTIQVQPGGGIFSSVVRYYHHTKKVAIVARVSKVSKGSHLRKNCVIYSHLQPYCHCKPVKLS